MSSSVGPRRKPLSPASIRIKRSEGQGLLDQAVGVWVKSEASFRALEPVFHRQLLGGLAKPIPPFWLLAPNPHTSLVITGHFRVYPTTLPPRQPLIT